MRNVNDKGSVICTYSCILCWHSVITHSKEKVSELFQLFFLGDMDRFTLSELPSAHLLCYIGVREEANNGAELWLQ